MQPRLLLLMVSLLLIAPIFAVVTCTFTPMNWTWNSNDSSTLTKSFYITNNGNESALVGMTASGSGASYLIFNPTNQIAIYPGSAISIAATVNPAGAAVGTYSTTISLTGSCTNSFVAQGTVPTVQTTYACTKTTFANEGDTINVTPVGYKINIIKVTDAYMKFDLYTGSTKLETGYILEPGDVYTEGDTLKISLVKVYSSGASKVSISVDESSCSLAVSGDTSDTVAQCKLQSSWNSRSYSIESGKTLTDSELKIRNMCPANIDLQSVSFSTAGNQLFQLTAQGTKSLAPNEDFSIPIKIDATNVLPGDFTNSIVAMGYMGTQQMTATIPLAVKVTEGTISYSGNPPTFVVPPTASLNQDYVIQTSNVVISDTITPVFSPSVGVNCDPGTKQVINNIWSLKCRFSKAGTYHITLAVTRNGLPIASSDENTVLVGLNDVSLGVYLFKPIELGVQNQIIVTESLGNTTVDTASITVNGVATSSTTFTPNNEGKYTICAYKSPYKDNCQDFILEKPKIPITQIETVPQYPITNESVTFTVRSVNIIVPNPTVKVDGILLTGPYQAVAGMHTIEATGEGYANFTSSFTVYEDASIISEPQSPKVGDVLVIGLSAPTAYEVSYQTSLNAPPQKLMTRVVGDTVSVDTTSKGAGLYILNLADGTQRKYQVDEVNALDILNPFSPKGSTKILGIGIPNILLLVFGLIIAYILIVMVVGYLGGGGKSNGGGRPIQSVLRTPSNPRLPGAVVMRRG